MPKLVPGSEHDTVLQEHPSERKRGTGKQHSPLPYHVRFTHRFYRSTEVGHLLQGVVRNVLKEMIPELNHKR